MLIRHPDGDAGVLGVDGVLGVVPPPDAAAPQMPRAVPVWASDEAVDGKSLGPLEGDHGAKG